MSSLYAVLLGGSGGPGRLSEDHETVFVGANDEKEARRSARAKWSGRGKGHADPLELVDVVDVHSVTLSTTDKETDGFFTRITMNPLIMRMTSNALN